MPDDLRLIEDYLPIEAISAEASREKSVRKGHISTLHLWWARRPLVACRAAVYGALVPADRWVKDVNLKNPPEDAEKATKAANGKKKGLNRKAAKEFVTKLCRYPKTNPTREEDQRVKRETEATIVDAQRHILEAHADRLTAELAEAKKTGNPPTWVGEFQFTGERVSYDDIVAGRAPRPRVLDMFAGGGAIPLEALRLGCEAYALDLNPVAHIIQLCTLVYPQKYGKPDPNVRGMTGPKNTQGETTWGGLAAELEYWGNWVLHNVRDEIGDLYPLVPDPNYRPDANNGAAITTNSRPTQLDFPGEDSDDAEVDASIVASVPPGYLLPVMYLWTRTVACKNPSCGTEIPLVKQTWLCKSKSRYVALAMRPSIDNRSVKFEVVEASTPEGLGFDPTDFSKGGNAVCPCCGTVADADYTKAMGCQKKIGHRLMAIVCIRPNSQGKQYVSADCSPVGQDWDEIASRLSAACAAARLSVPDEPISSVRPSPNARGLSAVTRYGLLTFGDLFNARQALSLIAFTAQVRRAADEMKSVMPTDQAIAVSTYLGTVVDRLADFNSSFCLHNFYGSSRIAHTFGRHAIAMTWDYAEANPFHEGSGGWGTATITAALHSEDPKTHDLAHVSRGSATNMPFRDDYFDAVVSDPPYYDNVPYADVSDFFYVWLKRSIGSLFVEHFSSLLTPKKSEATALASRHGGNMAKATIEYEEFMHQSMKHVSRMLKPGAPLVLVYAHKTTIGWSTLVESLRKAGLVVCEAWPLDTEKPGRLVAFEAAALASSIFLVARKRSTIAGVGNYEDDIQPDLQQIVRERVETLWEMGIAGADLVIACVGAGLRAFTKYEKVKYANGEEVPAEKFLAEVEGVVLDTMMGKLFGQASSRISAIDPASRFYILWRFVYKASEIEAGEAIVFTYAQHVELDGPLGLSTGKAALVEKKKAKYRTRDFTERGDNDKLGLPSDDGQPAPLIDVLHRALWLLEHSPRKLSEFLIEADPDRERLRLLAQALVGAALSGKTEEDASKLIGTTPAERSALGKLLANWKAVIENAVVSPAERSDKKAGQKRLEF